MGPRPAWCGHAARSRIPFSNAPIDGARQYSSTKRAIRVIVSVDLSPSTRSCRHTEALRRFAPQGKRSTRTEKAPVRSPAYVIPSAARDPTARWLSAKVPPPLRVVRDDNAFVGRLLTSSRAQRGILLRVGSLPRSLRRFASFGTTMPSLVACLRHPERSEGSYCALALCQGPSAASRRSGRQCLRWSPAYVIPSAARDPTSCWLFAKV